MRVKLVLLLVAGLGLSQALSQSPVPVIVPAQTETLKQRAAMPRIEAHGMEASLKILLDMRAANEETLKKQQAGLETLDELQKAADDIKIYTRRS
jgi:hypothetical protein